MTGDTQTADNEKDSKRLTIYQAVEILIDRKKQGDHLYCYSPDGLKFLHLRYSELPIEKGSHIKFMFKRSPEMKPYYPKIRAWFADNDLEWKDVTVDDVRYMAALLPLQSALITDYANSVQKNLFGFEDYQIGSIGSSNLSMELMGFSNPLVFMLSIVTLAASMGCFIVYQFTKIFDIGPPSMQALHKTEILLFILFSVSFLSLQRTATQLRQQKKSTVRKRSNRAKVWLNRLLLIIAISTMFFTY